MTDAPFLVEGLADPEDAGGVPLTLAVRAEEWVVVRTSPTRARRLQFALLDLERAGTTAAPTAARVLGEPIPFPSRRVGDGVRARLGTLLNPDGLISAWTLWENLALPLLARRQATTTSRVRVERALERFGIGAWRFARPPGVPNDVRQRAALARATITDPEALLLDDPLASVASRHADALYSELRVRVPTALILVHRRAESLYARADRVGTWDARGWRQMGSDR
ncbi:MAG: hypothetical protein WD771_09355 [Gemmatimonadaceae bacterium]